MINESEGILWILIGVYALYSRIKSPFPKWKPDITGANGKLVIAGIGSIVIGILMIIGEAKPIITPYIIGN